MRRIKTTPKWLWISLAVLLLFVSCATAVGQWRLASDRHSMALDEAGAPYHRTYHYDDDQYLACEFARRVGFDYRAAKILAEFERGSVGKAMVRAHLPKSRQSVRAVCR